MRNTKTMLRKIFLVSAAIAAMVLGCDQSVKNKNDVSTKVDVIAKADKSFTVNGTAFTMKHIPQADDITLGNTYANKAITDNKVRKISLSEYFIGETEVTQDLYKSVTGKNPSYFQNNAGTETQGMRPVEQISWYEALAFCNELTKKINGNEALCVYYADVQLKTVYTYAHAAQEQFPYIDRDKSGFRLPTEAEWEYAARGGENFKYAGADDVSELKHFAWYDTPSGGDANDKTHQVATKKPNAYGIYDMSGNVMEFCWDFYHNELPENEKDPHGNPNHAPNKIVRGGSWRWGILDCEVAYRDVCDPIGKTPAMGLRLAYGISVKNPSIVIPKEKLTVGFSVEGETGGSITAQEGINGKIHTVSPIEVKPGTIVIFHAKPETGYAVESWKGLTASPTDAASPHKTIYSDSEISVKFKKLSGNNEELVTVTQPDNGKITVKKDGQLIDNEALKKITEGTELEIILTANSGCIAKSLTVGANKITESKDGGKTISTKLTVTNAITISGVVEYEMVEVNFSVEGGLGGSLEMELVGSSEKYKNGPVLIRKGAMVGFQATPNSGYAVESWKGITVNPPNAKYTQQTINEAVTVSVKFKSGNQQYCLNYRVEGEGGTLEAEQNFKIISSGSYIEKGKIIKLYAEPSGGYEVKSWSGIDNVTPANTGFVQITYG